MLKDFKTFVLRGNVVDLAVGIVIGAAFGAVVTSLVENILTPIIAIPGTADFSSLSLTISGSEITYGQFLNDLIAFLLIAVAVFFFVVKPVNRLMALHRTEPDMTARKRDCPACFSSVPARATLCAFCTSELTPVG